MDAFNVLSLKRLFGFLGVSPLPLFFFFFFFLDFFFVFGLEKNVRKNWVFLFCKR